MPGCRSSPRCTRRRRRPVGERWSVDEAHASVAGTSVYVYRAIDGQGQAVDVFQHFKGCLAATRGFKTLSGARALCRASTFIRNLRGGYYEIGPAAGVATAPLVSPLLTQ